MAKIIALANQKGGVGKTTTCVNLAASLANLNYHILIVDFDPQGNTTMGTGVNKQQAVPNINDVMLEKVDIHHVLVSTTCGADLLPSNADLTEAEIVLLQKSRKEFVLKEKLQKIKNEYDFIFIDCPPSLNLLTLNALNAADTVIVPVQCEYYALEGLSGLLETIQQLQQVTNPKLKIEGFLRTMFDSRNRLANDVSAQLQEHFPDKLFNVIVPRNVRLAEAPSYGQPVLLYDRLSQGAQAYMQLAEEILQRQGNFN